jgi:phospholipid/cholesterol/gamma-HCH transport system ATP-binding protein
MIVVECLEKSFGEKSVLQNINVMFERGKVNLVIGRSGSGKTVLLKCLIGLLTPTDGAIFYDKKDFHHLSFNDQKKLRMDMGVVFQGSALFDSLTIEENVMFPLNIFTHKSYPEKLDRVNYCLQRVDLYHTNTLYPSEFSGGMKKRAAIARAIAINPKYLFCDEPNSGLDPKTSLIIDELITGITHEYNMTTIVNTHDLNSVITIGETISFIKDGNLEWNGTKEEVLVSKNENLNDFIYAQPITQKIRDYIIK